MGTTLITKGAQKFHSLIELLHEQLNIRLLQAKNIFFCFLGIFFRKVFWGIEYEHRSKVKIYAKIGKIKTASKQMIWSFFF